jgi:hypothetical protein
MKTTHSFQSCERDGPPSLAPHHAGSVGVTGVWDRPPFVVSRALHSSVGEKADALSVPLINPGVGSELSLQFSLVA